MFMIKLDIQKKKIKSMVFIAVFSSVCFPFLSLAETQNKDQRDVNKIFFPDHKWDHSILGILDDGPAILARDIDMHVAPPPLNDSDETIAELDELVRLSHEGRDEKTVEIISAEYSGVAIWDIYINAGVLDRQNDKTLALLQLLDREHTYYIMDRKKHFIRPRPTQLRTNLKLIKRNPMHPAYPSGHASQAHITALILADFDPDNAETYMRFGYNVGYRREIAGVHYPSDSHAGRALAKRVLEELRDIPAFEKKYQAAKESYTKPDLSNVDVATYVAYTEEQRARDYNFLGRGEK